MATDGTATPDRITTAPYVIEPSNRVPPAGWGWTRFLLLPQLLAAFYFQVRIAVSDLRLYAVDLPAALSILFWILSATATLWAIVGLMLRAKWWASLLISETLIALEAAYVLWVDYTSPYPDRWARILALIFLATALIAVVPLGIRVGSLPGKAWAAGLALLSALGLTQFVVQNEFLPNRQRPAVDVQIALRESARTGHFSTLKGTVTFKNDGHATVQLVNGFLELRVVDNSSRPDAPLNASKVTPTFDALTYSYRPYSRILPKNATAGVIWLDEISVVGSFLEPGVTIRREFTIRVDRRQGVRFDLRATMSMFTNARLDSGQVKTCAGKPVSYQANESLARTLIKEGGWNTTCLVWGLQPRNSIRAWLDDRPEIEFGYAFAAPAGTGPGPWLGYITAEDNPANESDQIHTAQRSDRGNPSEILTTNAALAVKP